MSADLEEDISVLNINEPDEDQEGVGFNIDCQGINCSRGLSVLGIRHNFTGDFRLDNGNCSAMSRQEDLLKELQALRDVNRALQQERGSIENSRVVAQKECLHLRDKVSSLFRENCSLKEQSAKLTIDNRGFQKQVESLKQNNARLKDRLQQFSHQLRCFVRNKDGVSQSPTSPMFSQNMEQVKMMLESIGNLPKSNDDSKESYLSNEKKDMSKTAFDKLPGKEVVSLELDHENLEKISHKLLEHLQQEKKELEQQYSQMVEVQKLSSNFSPDGLETSLEISRIREKEMFGLLESCRSSTKLLKEEVLIQNQLISTIVQQTALIGTLQKKISELETLQQKEIELRGGCQTQAPDGVFVSNAGSSIRKEPVRNVEYDKKSEKQEDFNVDSLMSKYGQNVQEWSSADTGKSTSHEIPGCESFGAEEDRICPMCHAVFPKAVPLPEFEAHVMDHFRFEEFEIITKDSEYG